MPPGILQSSKSKMQSWVLNSGHAAKPAPPTGNRGYMADGGRSPQKGHVSHSHPSSANMDAVALHDNSPPRTQYQSRMPIVNHNANNRAAVASTARLPSRSGTQPAHSRDTSLNNSHHRAISTEPLQNPARHAPFWEGSTIDGSIFSDTASVAEPRLATQSRMTYEESMFKATPRQHQHQPRSPKRDSDNNRPPFIIGENGMIDVLNTPMAKGSFAHDNRSRANPKLAPLDSDIYIEEDRLHPDRSPPNHLKHQRAGIPLRTFTKRESFSERTSHAAQTQSLPQDQAYHTPDATVHQDRNQLRVPEDGTHRRSTVFENIDTPLNSCPALDVESVGEPVEEPEPEQETPKPKPAARPIQTVNRQLFSKGSKGSRSRPSLRESSMPRLNLEQRQSAQKKRQFDLDYDDASLAAMDYTKLRKQPFDYDPAQAESQSSKAPIQGTLSEKLSHYLEEDVGAQADFFNAMGVRDWDDAGDWFLEKFGDVMHRLRDARRAKRQLVDKFETEIAEREDAVSTKIHNIGSTLEELKAEGEGMMQGKELE